MGSSWRRSCSLATLRSRGRSLPLEDLAEAPNETTGRGRRTWSSPCLAMISSFSLHFSPPSFSTGLGLCFSCAFCHTIAARYGALAGFGLSLAKWTLIVKRSTDLWGTRTPGFGGSSLPSASSYASELWCSSGRSSDPGPTFPRTPESAYSSSTKSYLRSLHETYYTKILHICQNCYYQNMLSFPKRSLRIYEWTIRQPHSFHKQWKGLGRIEDLYTHRTPYLCVVRLDKEYLFSILL